MEILIDIVFFSLKKDSKTRGHKVTLLKDRCRLDIRKYSLSQRTINEWKQSSTYCVNTSSVNMFKSKFDPSMQYSWSLNERRTNVLSLVKRTTRVYGSLPLLRTD